MHSISLTGTVIAASLLLAGCGPSDYAPATGSNAADIFASACANCHGDGGEGKMGMVFKLKGTELSDAEIAAKIATGSSLMPAFPNISEEERLAIAGYLKN